ncbi:MAG: hypothetical protein DWQ04_24515 [Chloroflexi bacterium]|nr:MAG: hypothetical protein DWQ04_24515 [Chloroflexota bacterium]
MNFRNITWICLSWIFGGLILVGCASGESLAALAETAVPTIMVTAELPTSTPTLLPTVTPTLLPTDTKTPTPEPTATMTPSPTVAPTATLVPTETAVPINRACPEPAPLKPEYNRYFLSPQKWPTPDPSLTNSHFWMAKPLPGAGRFLVNQTFPYGSDSSGRYLLHNGVDSAEKLGTPVLAVADGTIVVAQSDMNEWYGWRCDWYGQLVVLQLDETWLDQPIFVLYGHVLNINVDVGQRVKQGDPVAEIGFGGVATAPHLHLEVRIGTNEFDATQNPMLWIDPGPTRGVVVGRLLDPEGRPWQGVTVTLIPKTEDPEFINTWTYLDDPLHMINPDEGFAENFVFADVRPGTYDVFTKIQGKEYRIPVEVIGGQISTVELVSAPFVAPTASLNDDE